LPQFQAHALLGLGRPLVHTFVAQLPQRFNQLRLDGIGRLDGTLRVASQLQDALKARPQFGMLAERFEELFLG